MQLQGRHLTEQDLALIRELIRAQPEWNRTRLSRELCAAWNWRNVNGQQKDMAYRTVLRKLERLGTICLPAPRAAGVGNSRRVIRPVAHNTEPITGSLRDLLPLRIEVVKTSTASILFRHLLAV